MSLPTSNGFNRNYHIRGTNKDYATPHAACPICFLDATSADTATLLEFRCERGHSWIQTRKASLDHAVFLARFQTGLEANR